MTLAELRVKIKHLLRYPDSLLTDEMLQTAVDQSLSDLNALTGGKPNRGYSVPDGAKVIRRYYSVIGLHYPYFDALSYPFPPPELSGTPPPVYYVYLEPWTLDNIYSPPIYHFIQNAFESLVALYSNIVIANKLYLSRAIEGLPFDLRSDEVISQSEEAISQIKQSIVDNWVVPSV